MATMKNREFLEECKKHNKDKFGPDGLTEKTVCIYRYQKCSDCHLFGHEVKDGKVTDSPCTKFTEQNGMSPEIFIRASEEFNIPIMESFLERTVEIDD